MNRRNGRFATQFFYSPETVQKLNRRHAMAAAEAEAKGEEVVVDFTLQLDHHPIEEHSRPEKH